MANTVYLTVCDTLSNIVSRRAAENIVQEALLASGSDAARVTAQEMQDVLRGRIFSRLQQIMPINQARLEVKSALGKLEALTQSVRKPLAPEVLEGLEALRKEFAPFAEMQHPRAQELAHGIASLEQAADPVKKLNALWAELDVLQQELGFIGTADPSASAPPKHPTETETGLEGFEGVDLDFMDESTASVPHAPVVEHPVAGPGVALQPETTVATLPRPSKLKLNTPHEADAVLSRFALEEGVIGVVLSDWHGQVIQAKLPSGEADHLAGVAAAIRALLGKRKSFGVFFASLSEASVFVAPLDEWLLTVLADTHINVGRVLNEVKAIKEDV